jgi:hypothetical protein
VKRLAGLERAAERGRWSSSCRRAGIRSGVASASAFEQHVDEALARLDVAARDRRSRVGRVDERPRLRDDLAPAAAALRWRPAAVEQQRAAQ